MTDDTSDRVLPTRFVLFSSVDASDCLSYCLLTDDHLILDEIPNRPHRTTTAFFPNKQQ
jgi:hypothetical protein